MRQPGLPGLALVLALTMVLGFAATASAYWTNVESDLFLDPDLINYTIDGEDIDDLDNAADVDGNKEYTIKAKFYSNNLNNFFGASDTTYDVLADEYQVLKAIQAHYNFTSKSWTAGTVTGDEDEDANNIRSAENDLYQAVAAIVDNPRTDSVLYAELINAIQNEGGTFEDGYTSSDFERACKEVEREWYNIYDDNSYFGYQDGFGVTASSSDSTYATVTSQPTVSAKRVEVAGEMLTEYTVSLKVRFTNTTFRTAEVDIDINYSAGGSVPQAIYTHEDTLSFTVFQAAGSPGWQVAHGDR